MQDAVNTWLAKAKMFVPKQISKKGGEVSAFKYSRNQNIRPSDGQNSHDIGQHTTKE